MTAAQRDAITSPATGLMIFCTDNNQYYFNQGTPAAKNWVMMNSQWLANGSNIYYNAGNVGLGTSSPIARLDVYGGVIKLRGGAYLQLDAISGGDKFGYISSAGNTAGTGLKFETPPSGQTNGLVRMTITNEGNVGIGTTAPHAPLQFSNATMNRKLVLWESPANNNHQYYGFGLNDNTLRYQVYEPSSSHVFYAGTGATTSNELMRIQGNGNVGIGFISPFYKLDIGTTSLGTTAGNTVPWLRLFGFSNNLDQLRIYHNRYATGSDWGTAEIRIQKTVDNVDMHYISFKGGYNTTVGSLVFGFQNTEQMVIENDGNIGIGSTNPSSLVHLYANKLVPLVPDNSSEVMLKIQSNYNGKSMLFDNRQIQTVGNSLRLNANNAEDVYIAAGGGNVGINSLGNGGGLTVGPTGSSVAEIKKITGTLPTPSCGLGYCVYFLDISSSTVNWDADNWTIISLEIFLDPTWGNGTLGYGFHYYHGDHTVVISFEGNDSDYEGHQYRIAALRFN
jgi:hypothetical protein